MHTSPYLFFTSSMLHRAIIVAGNKSFYQSNRLVIHFQSAHYFICLFHACYSMSFKMASRIKCMYIRFRNIMKQCCKSHNSCFFNIFHYFDCMFSNIVHMIWSILFAFHHCIKLRQYDLCNS